MLTKPALIVFVFFSFTSKIVCLCVFDLFIFYSCLSSLSYLFVLSFLTALPLCFVRCKTSLIMHESVLNFLIGSTSSIFPVIVCLHLVHGVSAMLQKFTVDQSALCNTLM